MPPPPPPKKGWDTVEEVEDDGIWKSLNEVVSHWPPTFWTKYSNTAGILLNVTVNNTAQRKFSLCIWQLR